jgi:hypothetical protein
MPRRNQTLGTCSIHDVHQTMTKLSDLGPPIQGRRYAGDPGDERDNFYICPTCGQAVDARDLRQLTYHEQPEHEPLELDA